MSTPFPPPTTEDIFRYRYQYGTNLGSIFVLERWLTPSMFIDNIPGDSELDAVAANIRTIGLDATRSKFEAHWNNALTTEDFEFLTRTAHINTIRLPIGYFTLGPQFCANTPFAGDIATIYSNAWSIVRNLINKCHDHGIGVLLDLHAVPGGANAEIHSGTSSNTAALWANPQNLSLTTSCLLFLAQESLTLPNITGLQLNNESPTTAPSLGMYDFYGSTIWSLSQIHPSLPIYISDAWDLSSTLGFSQRVNAGSSPALNPVIVDTHRYFCFADSDKATSPQDIISRVRNTELNEVSKYEGDVFNNSATGTFIGEYSNVIDPSSWSRSPTASDQSSVSILKRELGLAQCTTHSQKSGGATFWTYKMDWMPGGDWGFKQQVLDSNLSPPPHFLLSPDDIRNRSVGAEQNAQRLYDVALSSHTAYWDGAAPGQGFEHWRFGEGWWGGWRDAGAFFGARGKGVVRGGGDGGDRIGYLDLWVRKRMGESGNAKERTGFGWEWEQGFRRGVRDFYAQVGI